MIAHRSSAWRPLKAAAILPATGTRWSTSPRAVGMLPVLLLLALPAALQAQDYTCTTNNGAITITGYTGSGGAVAIPRTISGLPVASIGDWAFYECTDVTDVTIGNGVTNIGDYAFFLCTGLTNVTIPASVSSIGNSPFNDCPALAAITVDANSPAYIKLDGVLFDKSQTTLIQCPGAKAGPYTIPNTVTNIADSAFSECVNLTSVMIPGSVTTITEDAFWGCRSLTNVTIPASVSSIGTSPFADCPALAAITVDTNNPAYVSSDGVLFDKSRTTLIQYPGRQTRTLHHSHQRH